MSSRKLKRFPAALALGLLALAGCTDAAGYDLDMLMGKAPWLATMRNGVQYDPYEGGPRPAPEGSVAARGPNGDRPAHFTQTQLDSAAATLRSPYPVDAAFRARARSWPRRRRSRGCSRPARRRRIR